MKLNDKIRVDKVNIGAMENYNLIIVLVSVIIFIVNYTVFYEGPRHEDANALAIVVLTVGTLDMIADTLWPNQ